MRYRLNDRAFIYRADIYRADIYRARIMYRVREGRPPKLPTLLKLAVVTDTR